MPLSWTDRVWSEFRAGNLTRAYRDVLLTLRTYRGRGGLICPAHATLADRAGSCVRTVQRALVMARRLGLVSWAERRVRAAWRWLRTSNRYMLELPDEPVQRGLRPAWPNRRTNGQNVREGERTKKEEAREERQEALASMLRAAAAMPDLLAARRRTMELRWRAEL